MQSFQAAKGKFGINFKQPLHCKNCCAANRGCSTSRRHIFSLFDKRFVEYP